MNKTPILVVLALLISLFFSCKQSTSTSKSYEVTTETDANGYTYEMSVDDPTGLRLYTLENGLKVYLSKNTDEPKIQTYIAVRTGSNYDPADNTGLAHYLEHMLFKGTDEIASKDWEKEKVMLQQISDLFEKHKAEQDPDEKIAIYKEIDELSYEASKLVVANEYDNLVAALGAERTNAHTWYEETVYKNKIPANELKKWLTIEQERFSQLVLRLFHTELEAVYEEFNRAQDSDRRALNYARMEHLFPTHPYGQQTTLGTSEHLKNPSMEAIHAYFNKYYVPNNMAVVLVGDIDFDKSIQLVDNTFGKFERKELVRPELPKEKPLEKHIVDEVFGPTAASVSFAYRTDGVGSKDHKYITLIDMILANGNAGIIDLNLNQQQKVQNAYCNPRFMTEYGIHVFVANPKEGQSLDEAKDLLMAQIEHFKKGEFEEWMIEAVVNDLKLGELRKYENATRLASDYFTAFIQGQNWIDNIKFLDEIKHITKEELVAFANDFYKDNYVLMYKRQGENKDIVKVDKPGITPVVLDREAVSEFGQKIKDMDSGDIQPLYVDYEKEIQTTTLDNGLSLSFIENKANDLFNLNIIFDMGRDHHKKLAVAIGYLEYLGNDQYSAEELKKEFYKIGINYSVNAAPDRCYISLSGLKENLADGLKLLEELLESPVAQQDAYDKYVETILKGRSDNKAEKRNILWRGLASYAKYGENSRLRNILSAAELEKIDPQELVGIIKDLKNFKHRIFYYGKDVKAAKTALNQLHIVPETLKDYPEAVAYEEKETGGNVYYVDYDMVQAEIMFLAKGKKFDKETAAASKVFNNYFGSGLSSIVFQEIRESKSLAYSAFAGYRNPSKKEDSHYVMSYLGTQANKLPDAVDAMMELMSSMPEAEKQFQSAKESTLKSIAAQRITKQNVFWQFENLKKLGYHNDNRKEIYEEVQKMTMDDVKNFFNTHIKGENYNVVVIGNKENLNFNALEKLGKVQEMDIDYLFNYDKKVHLN